MSAIPTDKLGQWLLAGLGIIFTTLCAAVGRWLITLIKAKITTELQNRAAKAATEHARQVAIVEMQQLLPILKNIALEFRPNGGSTFRDKLDQAVTLSQKQIDLTHGEIAELRNELKNVNTRLNRYIAHEARNDLNVSNLAKEAEQQLADMDREKRSGTD